MGKGRVGRPYFPPPHWLLPQIPPWGWTGVEEGKGEGKGKWRGGKGRAPKLLLNQGPSEPCYATEGSISVFCGNTKLKHCAMHGETNSATLHFRRQERVAVHSPDGDGQHSAHIERQTPLFRLPTIIKCDHRRNVLGWHFWAIVQMSPNNVWRRQRY